MALITSDCPPHADAIRVSLVLCSAGGGQDRANLVRPPRRPGWISALLLRMVTPPGPGAVHYADFYGVGAAEETPRSKFPHTALFWCCGVALPSPHSLGSCSPPLPPLRAPLPLHCAAAVSPNRARRVWGRHPAVAKQLSLSNGSYAITN